MKKKVLAALLALPLIFAFAGCAAPEAAAPSGGDAATSTSSTGGAEQQGDTTQLQVINVGASPAPHAEILEVAKEVLKEEGYDLKITEFVDYVQPNLALDSGELDANYFQHKPYLDNFNEERGTKLVSAAAIHYEPYGIYAGKTKSLDELKDGAQVAVPADASNEARALLLLEAQGLIKLKDSTNINATKNDIVENPKNLNIIEIEAAQLPRSLQDVDIAVINGNYAIEAGLSVNKDALAKEDAESVAATTYGNIVAVKEGKENDPAIQALVKALQSDKVKTYIEETYDGGVLPLF
ncbi:MetQ/NlpA family ABC transporter substrate-binding protein [Christensenellaceae bacterium NSJ-44]|uniref:Lipoprotein n=1 Tax=Luoshenia tenuis TaxID=2763654 RepID=A0A926CXR6_9FIRM|nr:MetQ/NlpA family ABC transporter substrate-binding protein [Luoshenia tenuis]MBC8528098.1 MetQ/NlpA family ABC transporter substrate-binding protein [Luoshenia tenuis]